MSPQHRQREHRALEYLRHHRKASAGDIGRAAVAGEHRARRMSWTDKEAIGLGIACRLVQCGLATATRGNLFSIG